MSEAVLEPFLSSQMTYPSHQNICFPDTIAVCLDEDKSVVSDARRRQWPATCSRLQLTCFYNDHSFYIWDTKNERSIKKRDSQMFHAGCGWGIEVNSIAFALTRPVRRPFSLDVSANHFVAFGPSTFVMYNVFGG